MVLVGQHGGRHQHRHLTAVHHHLEGPAQGHFGLAKPHVPDNQAIHVAIRFQIRLDVDHGLQLVGRLLEGKGHLQGRLHGLVGSGRLAGGGLPVGVDRQQLLGNLLHFLAHLVPRGGPPAGTQPRQHRILRPDIPTDAIGLVHRHQHLVPGLVVDLDVLLVHAAHGAAGQAGIGPDAEVHVHHRIARVHLGKEAFGSVALVLDLMPPPIDLLHVEQFGVRHHLQHGRRPVGAVEAEPALQ